MNANTLNTDGWQYRGGKISHSGPSSVQPKTENELFRFSEAKWSALWPAAQEVSAGVDQDIVDENSFLLRRSGDPDVHGETFADENGPVKARFSIDEPYSSTSFTMDGQSQNVVKK